MGNSLWSNICFMLGGIAVLMFGMRVMGSNLEQIAGNKMKVMLRKLTNNRFAGVGVGAAVTAIINSSTATTVMLVGFVNIGLMSLAQATSVIMGANIGTTITAILLAITGTGFEIEAIAAFISAVGMFMILFVSSEKPKKIGNIMVGVGMIFIGLKIMSQSVSGIIYDDDEVLRPIFNDIFQGDIFPLVLILLGIILTAIVHSSGAVTGILIALGGALKFESAVFIILGSNIGTCITSLTSAIGTNTNAKRTAVIHLLFNSFGCLLFIVPIWIFKSEFAEFMFNISGGSPEWEIALFHLGFNLITTAILLPFIDGLVKLVTKIIPDKTSRQDEKHRLTFIDERLMQTPAIAVGNIKNEIIKMSAIARENINLCVDMLLDKEKDHTALVKDNEDAINYLNKEITLYLTKIAGKSLSVQDENKVGSYYHVVSDVERVGDYAENVMEYSMRLREQNIDMSADAKKEIDEMRETVNQLFDKSIKVLDERNLSLLGDVDKLEEKIDKYNTDLELMHIERLKLGQCSAQVGSVYLQTVSNLERVGDHITNIAFSIKKYEKGNNKKETKKV